MAAPASRLTQNTLSSQASDTVHRLKGAVCQIDTNSPGTGFLVTPNCILTCCHVLPEREIAQNAYACFSDIQEATSLALNPDRLKNGFYQASKLQHEDGRIGFTAKNLDFVIVSLSQTIEKVSDLFVLSDQFPPQKERIHVIQHPVIEVVKRDPDTNRPLEIKQLTGEMRIAIGQVTGFDNYIIHHTAPVAGGSSGAPIVNDAGHLYAFHQAECTNQAHKKCTDPEHAKSKNPVHKECEILSNCGIGVRTDAVFRYLRDHNIELDDLEELRRCTALKAKYANNGYLKLIRPVRGYKDWKLKFPIAAIYTELVILQARLKKKEEQNRGDSSFRPDQGLESYETLFMDKESISRDKFFTILKNSKKLLILGAAGTGKTTFCQHLAFQWSKDRILTEYQALFWIRLRHLKKNETLEMLFQRVFGFTPSDKCIRCALLILDGFDELPPYAEALFRELTTRFQHVIVTSRPKTCIPFQSAIQLETIGLDKTNSNTYIEHYFSALHTQYPEELAKEDVMPKTHRLQALLLTHPLLASLAHIPVNLSLLCAIFSQEEDFLTNQQPITVTALYDYIVNWLYIYFQIRQKELSPSIPDSTSDLVSQSNPLSDPDVRNLDHILRDIALNYTQNNMLYTSQAKLENLLINQNNKLKINQLNDSGLFKIERGEGEFIHLSYQDFFVARYLADLYATKQREKAQAFVKAYKLQERYKWIFWMTAGLLSIQDIGLLSLYFEDLHTQAPDLGKSYELKLLAHCYGECQHPSHLSKYSIFLKKLLKFLRKNPNRDLKNELFKHNHELLFLPHVIEFVCNLPANELALFILQIINFKQKIPSKILEQICENTKKSKIILIDPTFSILGEVAENDQQLTDPCMQFICSFLQTQQDAVGRWFSPGQSILYDYLGFFDYLGFSAPSVYDQEGRSIIDEDYRENSTKAYRILITVLKQKKKALPPGEDLFDWIDRLNIHQEFKFCMILEYLNEEKQQPEIQDSRYLSYLNHFLNLESPSTQETFDRLICLISKSSSFILNRYLLKLISILASRERETINTGQAVIDLIKLSKEGNRWAAEALISLATMGFLLNGHIKELISYFDLHCSGKTRRHNNPEAKYFITQILVEYVKNENILSLEILNLFKKNHSENALIQIAKAKQGHALDAFDCIKRDLKFYLNSIYFKESIINLLNDSYFNSNLDPFIHTLCFNSNLDVSTHALSLEEIDQLIKSIKKESKPSDKEYLLRNSIKNHSQVEAILEKIKQELISGICSSYAKSIFIEIYIKNSNNHNLKLEEIENFVSCMPYLKFKKSSKFITLIKLKINIDDISNNILIFLLKQSRIRISKNLIKHFIEKLDLEILLLLKYSDYIKKSWSRKLFIRIAYLTGQPFIEAGHGR